MIGVTRIMDALSRTVIVLVVVLQVAVAVLDNIGENPEYTSILSTGTPSHPTPYDVHAYPDVANSRNTSVTTDSDDVTSNNVGIPTAYTPPLSPANYTEFHIGNLVNFWAPPIISAIGVVGNVMCFLVMIQPHNRKSSPALYMAALAVLDFIMIVVGLFQYWCLFNFFPHLVTVDHCHGMFFVVNFVANYAVWVIVAMTIERVIAVLFPLKSTIWCSVKKTGIILVALCWASATKNLHYIWTADFVYNKQSGAAQCAFGLVRRGTAVIVWQWVDTALAAIIPFLVILTANCTIIVTVNRQRNSMSRLNSSTTGTDAEKRKLRSDSASITVMLIAVSLVFVLLTSPLFIFRTYFNFVPKDTPHIQAIYHMGHHICHKLWYLNNAINFYIYVLTGKKFRTDLCVLLRLEKSPTRKISSNTTSSSMQSLASFMTRRFSRVQAMQSETTHA